MPARRDGRSRRSPSKGPREVGNLRRALTIYREEARASVERWLDSEDRADAATARFHGLWENATIGYLRLDRAGTILDVNRVARGLLGGAEDARVVDKPLVVFADRAHAPTVLQHMMRCRNSESVVVSTIAVRETGRIVELISTRAFHADHAVEFNTFLSDLSERQAAEQAVRESEQRYRTIVETANEGICSVDADDRISFVNRRFTRMLGGDIADFVGKELPSFVHPDDREQARAAFRYRSFGVAGFMELRLCRLDGSTLWTGVSSSVIADASGGFGGVLRMFSDISDRKELEAMRARLVKHLVAAQEAERRRIARELHDQTGQHIVGLTLGLDSLAKIASASPETQRIVARLQQIAEGLSRDVHHLAVELRPAALDDLGLAAAVGNYADAMSDQFGVHVDLHCAVAQRLDPSIETTVYRVVQEALTNIVRHASAQQVSVIIESQPTLLHVVIEDDGVGFEVSRERQADGPGLGIIGMRERAALVGGELTIESSADNGTTLFLRVPLPREGTIDHEDTPRPAGG